MAEDNYNNISGDGVASNPTSHESRIVPLALIETRKSMSWLFKRPVLYVALALVIFTAIYSIFIFTRHADPAEIFIFSASVYRPDKPVTLLILARDAEAGLPLKNQSIDLYMGKDGKDFVKLAAVITGEDGIAFVTINSRMSGNHQIKAILRDLAVVSNIKVMPVFKSILTMDKQIYQPGQAINLRNLILNATDLHPVSGSIVNFKISDPVGKLVYDNKIKSSGYGIASALFTIPTQTISGEYKIQSCSDSAVAEQSITVKPYSLPVCNVVIDTGKTFYQPGDTVSGTVALYDRQGRPMPATKLSLSASVTIKVKQTQTRRNYQRRYYSSTAVVPEQRQVTVLNGSADSSGKFNFEFMIPKEKELAGIDFSKNDTECKISVTATAVAGQQQNSTRTLAVTMRPIHINYLPQFGQLLPDIPGSMYILVSDPCGVPLESTLQVAGQTLFTGKDGLALISSSGKNRNELISITDSTGHHFKGNIVWNYNPSPEAFILKTAKSIISAGEELQMEIVANKPGGRIFIHLVKGDTSLELIPVTLDSRQKEIKFILPSDIAGAIQIHAYRLSPNGKITHEARTVQVIPVRQLSVNTTPSVTDDTARIKFQITDRNGQPVQAALSIAGTTNAMKRDLSHPNVQASAMLPVEPVNQLLAGYTLAKMQNLTVLQVQGSLKYVDRENALIPPKIEFGNKLFSYSLHALLLFLFVISIPFLLVAVNRKDNSWILMVSAGCEPKIQLHIQKIYQIFGAITACTMVLIIVLWFNIYSSGLAKLYYGLLIALTVLFIIMLVSSVKVRNSIFGYCPANGGSKSMKMILMIPWFYGVFIFVFLIIALAMLFFPNTPWLGVMVCVYFVTSIIPLFGLRGIQSNITTGEYPHMSCIRKAVNMGFGIGTYPRSLYSLWIVGSGLFIGPVIMTYLFVIVVIISLFLPLTRILDCLGGGNSRYSSSSTSTVLCREYFRPLPTGLYFSLERTRPDNNVPVSVEQYFTETLFWQPELITDEHGLATVSFKLPGNIPGCQLRVNAITGDGASGISIQELSNPKGVK